MAPLRVRTEIWVSAGLRRCAADGLGAYVIRRGDAERGMVLLKLVQGREGATVLTLSRDLEGRLDWRPGLGGARVPESEADEFVAREVRRDPDLWVLEVETRDGAHPFDASLL